MPPEEPLELERIDMILDPPAPALTCRKCGRQISAAHETPRCFCGSASFESVCPTCGGKEIDGRCDLCQRSGTN